MKYFISLILLTICSVGSFAQMNFNGRSLFGNEWIQSGQAYWKIKVPEDGVYKISYALLERSGFPIGTVAFENIRLIRNGESVPMILSTRGIGSSADALLFFGYKNRSELDAPLFADPGFLMNPEYSMFNDTSAYYLTWEKDPSTKIVEKIANDLSAPLPKDEYFIQTQKLVFSDFSFKRGVGFGSDQKFPLFDSGQGFTSDLFKNRSFQLEFPQVYTDGPEAQIHVRITGFGDDNTAHKANFRIDGNSTGTEIFAGYKVRNKELVVPSNELKEKFDLNIAGEASPEDNLVVSVIESTYPRKFDFSQARFARIKLGKSVIRKYLELEQFDGGDTIYIYDLTNNYYLTSVRESNGQYRITIPESAEDHELLIWNKTEIKEVERADKVDFIEYGSADYSYVILYHPRLTDDGAGNNYVQAYADYRSSPEGGSYKVALVNIESLYDQFAYGIHTHSLAVRNFSQYIRNLWPKMAYMLIIGKGLEYPYYRKTGLDTQYFFVPTFCSPAADIMLVSDSQNKPLCSFGRLPVIHGSEIKSYLDKVKSHESYLKTNAYSLESREWIKRIIHLSGGDPNIYALISSQLAGMENVIEDNLSGAHVETFYKQSSSSIEVANSERLRTFINEGSSIIAFMGHSAAIRLDFNLENVDSYKNKDRYHVFMAMGCYAGSLFGPNRSISEDHNLAPEKGSILYIANTTAGYPDILGAFGSEFYKQIGGNYFGKPVGDALRETVQMISGIGGERLLTQAYSTTLNGDPAIRLNYNTSQDYTLDPKTVVTEPGLVFASQKEFELKFDVVSLGAFYKDSVLVTVEKVLPNGKRSIVFNQHIANPASRSHVSLKIPVGGDEAIGYNRIFISLDGKNTIAEGPTPEAENNNELVINGQKGYSLFVFGNEAKPVYPKEFAIIDTDRPILIACNGSTLADQIRYYFELDTTAYFNSPAKQSYSVVQTGGVISWPLNQSLLQNTVYYWRVAPDSVGAGQFAWRNASFIYLSNSDRGWNQSHFFQQQQDELLKMQLKEPDRQYKYAESYIEIRANNGYIELPTYIRPRVYVGTDVAADYEYWQYNSDFSGIVVNVFDPVTGRLWVNRTGGDFNSYSDSRYKGKPFFVFKTSTAIERASLIQFIEQSIPKDHVVLFSTLTQYQYSYYPELWESDGPKNIFSVLEAQGARQIRNLQSFNSVPYILIFRKDRTDFEVRESIGNFTDENEVSHSFTIPQTAGSVRSTQIGPAKAWMQFNWGNSLYKNLEDQQEINIYGIDASGSEKLLFGPLSQASQDLRSVDPVQYPNLRLEWKSQDTNSRTSPHLDFWRVHHLSLPDAAFNPALGYKKAKDTLNQGDVLNLEIMAQNIGEEGLDSLLVKFTLVNQANQTIVSYRRFAPIASLGSLKIPFSYATSSIYGAYKLFIELNPNNDQPELYSFNNTAIVSFFIRRDKRKPYVDVTFDKNRIINLDIVSSKSQIEISIQDENKDFLLNDTSAFVIKIKEPGGTAQRVYFAQSNVRFIPAAAGEKTVKAVIDGQFTKDGVYTLYVSAYDASGNAATELDYQIDFTVVLKSSVSNLLNYPNPFSTRTRFVYTLTGDVLPEEYMIQIMTISGKVVREISKEELGPLQIGSHMTDFEYNGTDQFGDRLANGVYLYRFIVRDRNKGAWEKYDNGTDQFFKNEFGKMVIIR